MLPRRFATILPDMTKYEVPAVKYEELATKADGESSKISVSW